MRVLSEEGLSGFQRGLLDNEPDEREGSLGP